MKAVENYITENESIYPLYNIIRAEMNYPGGTTKTNSLKSEFFICTNL